MTEQSESLDAPSGSTGTSPADADAASQLEEGGRPELLVAGAFAGGLVFALILKRVADG